MVVDRVRQDYLELIRRSVKVSGGRDINEVEVAVGAVEPGRTLAPAAGTESAITIEENLPTAAGKLNPDYTFINFIEGKSNSHARAAAEHVVETPGGTYNPLLIDRKSTRLNSSH